MIALGQYELSLCGGCGLGAAETFDVTNTFAYAADEPWVCHACVAKHHAAEKWAQAGGELTPGHRFVPERR